MLGTSGAWALLKAAFFVLPGASRQIAYTAGLAVGFGTVWAWLYFCSAYTGHTYHRNTSLRQLGGVIFLLVVAIKLTNPLHGAYFTTTEATTPFAYLAIEHNALHWTATGLSYVLAAIGLFMIYQFYQESGYETRSLNGLTALLALPVALDIGALFTPWLINVIYAPIGVAAFATGVLFVFDRRFLVIRQSTGADNTSIYLDERGNIRDYTNAAEEVFPELERSTGDRLREVVPSVADVVDGGDQVLAHERSNDQRYYFVSTSTLTLGDTETTVIELSDVTDTESQRRQLDRRNELYQAVIDASFAFVFRFDRDGRITFVSSSAEDVVGYSPEELEGQPISVTHPDTSTTERAWEAIDPVLNGESNKLRDFAMETKAGTTIYTDIRAVPIYEESVRSDVRTPEDIVEIQAIIRDATERRQREGLISVINRVLRHNLRNKMNLIIGYAELLEADLNGDDEAKATHIRDNAERLLDLSESAQKIDENRDASPELEPTDIAPILTRTASQIQMQYPEASITIDAPDTVIAETHDRLESALWELVDNAGKYGGDPPAISIDVSADETNVAVSVTDNGQGIPEMERQVLQSNTETQLVHGDGLGLWLVYWIVTSLDGELTATTSPEGTTVTIRLPKPHESL